MKIVSNINFVVNLYNEKFLKAKTKCYNVKIDNNFRNKKNTKKKGSKLIYLSVTLIDSVLRTVENHYPQVLLEECKYII